MTRSTLTLISIAAALILTCSVPPTPGPVRHVQTRYVTVISSPAPRAASTSARMTASRARRAGIRGVWKTPSRVTDVEDITALKLSAHVRYVRINSAGITCRRVLLVNEVSVEKTPLPVQHVATRPVWITRLSAPPPASPSARTIIQPAWSASTTSPIRTS